MRFNRDESNQPTGELDFRPGGVARGIEHRRACNYPGPPSIHRIQRNCGFASIMTPSRKSRRPVNDNAMKFEIFFSNGKILVFFFLVIWYSNLKVRFVNLIFRKCKWKKEYISEFYLEFIFLEYFNILIRRQFSFFFLY